MKAIIMAGGKGTRLKPLTNDIPKPMVKIIDKPVIECIINGLKRRGITQIAITLGYMADSIMSYLGDGKTFGVEISYFIEREPLGTAGGVKSAESFFDGDFIVLSGDAYSEIDLNKAIEAHYAMESLFTIIATPVQNTAGLGVLKLAADNSVAEFVEKPQENHPGLINCGIYIMSEKILKFIPDGFYDFGRDLLPKLVKKGIVNAFVTYDYWSDIGTLPSYYYTNYLVSQGISN
jgi:mannose-1-phosphate guanylyltransferase/phosphomannomutase